ncbi:heterokaryon incompatibility protein-domain-containing protein [Xylaria telfairii]|nr:heterokaryon incompatibility protein-domain-containing protein [Xylaria telfairii]
MAQVDEAEPDPVIDEWEEYVQPCLCRAPAYPYRRLIGSDIRLLNILPGDGDLECVLHEMPLTEEQVFYALSYVWGNEFDTEEILLDGQAFKVSRNLYEALQQLREQPGSPMKIGYPDEYFWIDAICLNQEDMEEKAYQVPRMMEIYRASLSVIIWLGPNKLTTKSEELGRRVVSSPTNPANYLLRGNLTTDDIVGLLFEKTRSLWIDWRLPDDPSEEDLVLREVFGELYGAVIQASTEILLRPWFLRLWTVQECSLGVTSTVLAGRHRVSLEKLIEVLNVLARHHRLIALASGYQRIHALGLIEKQWCLKFSFEREGQQLHTGITECILKILSYVTGAQATNPRDHLYALLGIVTFLSGKPLPIELRPDYRLPFAVIYWRYAAYLLQNSGDLRLLLTSRRELQGVPSWVTDFRHLSLRGKASCNSTIRVSLDKQILYLRGTRMEHICDRVGEWIDSKYLTVGTNSGLQYRIRYVEGRIFKLASQIRNVALENILDEFFWGVCVMFKQGGEDGVRKAYWNLKGHSHRNGAWVSQRVRAKTTDYFGKEFAIANQIRCSLVLLDDGTILSVSRSKAGFMPNDFVCVFKGATLPIIIRPSELGDGFILVSHCEIRSGTFHRQSFDKDFWADRKLEEFRLV